MYNTLLSYLKQNKLPYNTEELKQIVKPHKRRDIMSKAIIFSRTSTTAQDVVQQSDYLKREALRYGYSENDLIFIEYQESAIKLSIDERLGLQKLYHTMEENKDVDCVFVYEISRLSRQAPMLFEIRDWFIKSKIQLICCKPQMRLLDDDGNMSQTASILFSLFSTMAESEMLIRKERFARAKNSLRQDGKKFAGSVIFGYMKNEEKHCVAHPYHSEILYDLFNHYITHDDTSLYETYQYAMRKWPDVFPLREYIKAQHYIRHLFTTEIYVTGNWCYPQLITQEMWDKTHDKMSKAQCKPRYRSKLQLLGRGKVICAHCGNVMTAAGGNVKAYCCSTDKLHSLQMNIAALEWLIWEEVRVAININSSVDLAEKINTINNDIKQHNNEIKQLEKYISKLKTQQDKLLQIYLSGRMDLDKYNKRFDVIESEIKTKNEEINKNILQINELKATLNQTDNNTYINVDNITDFDVRLEYTRKLLDKVILEKQQDKVINIRFEWQRPMILPRSTYQYVALGGRRKIWRINEDGTRDFIYNNKPL